MTMRRSASWQEKYLNQFYRDVPGWMDGTTEFWDLIQRHSLMSAEQVLELGCGPDNRTSEFLKAQFGSLDGLDVDPEAEENPHLDTFHLYNGKAWPLPSNSYDLIVTDYVLEHVEDPTLTMAEAYRVLKPGGSLFFRTPNLWHYVSLASSMSPHWFHNLVANRLRNKGAEAHDPYPTFYRMNTERDVFKVMRAVGFVKQELSLVEKQPSYGMSSRLMFFPMLAYERFVNSSKAFSQIRSNLFGAFRKLSTPDS
ncbi:MAG: class I SAM-dependent methyltransferase [Deltaproteobacteria bacterium]|nr:MAG: class I SAM-dependent methyltransferase [Deltaproteobacteria bacterium]